MKRFLIILLALQLFLNLKAQTVYSELAKSYAEQGNYEEAIRLEKEGQEILISIKGTDNSDYALSLSNMAYYYFFLGELSKALEFNEKALKGILEFTGDNHPAYASSLFRHSMIQNALGNYEEAISLISKSIEILENNTEKADMLIPVVFSFLSTYYGNKGNYEEAIEASLKVIKKLELTSEEDNPIYLSTLFNLAKYYAEINSYENAIIFKNKELYLIEKLRGKNNIEYAESLHDMSIYKARSMMLQEAVKIAGEELELKEMLIGKEDIRYGTTLVNLAKFNSNLGKYTEALYYGKNACEVFKLHFEENPSLYADVLCDLAGYYYDLGKIDEAIVAEKDALKIRENENGNSSLEFSQSLNHISMFYLKSCNFQEAIKCVEEALKIRKQLLGTESLPYVKSLLNLAICKADLNYFNEALQLCLDAKKIIENNMDIMKEIHRECLYNLALFYYNTEKYDVAIELLENLLNKRDNVFNIIEYAKEIMMLAEFKFKLGLYHEAIKLNEEAVNIIAENLGMDNLSYSDAIENLGLYKSEIGDYNQANQLYSDAIYIKEKLLGQNNLSYIDNLINQASNYFKEGDDDQVIKLNNKAIELLEQNNWTKTLSYANALGNLSLSYSHLGNYYEAIKLGLKSLEIIKNLIGTNNLEYASSLLNLSSYYNYLGNYDQSLKISTEALIIKKQILGQNHIDVAECLRTTSMNYLKIDQIDEAIHQMNLSLDIVKNKLGKNHIKYVANLVNLAEIYAYKEDYAYSTELILEAKKILEDINKSTHHYYAYILNNLSRNEFASGKFHDSFKILRDCVNLEYAIWGPNHEEFINSIFNLTIYLYYLKDYENVIEPAIKVSEARRKEVQINFKYLSNKEREFYWSSKNSWSSIIAAILWECNNYELIKQAFNNIILSKGLLLNSEIEFDKFLTETGSPELTEKYNEIKNLRLQLNKLYEKPMAERWCDTDSLERVANKLERELMYESKEFGDYTRNLSITWENVRDNLKEKEVAIEFVSFRLNKDSTMYMAYVLRPGMDAPQMVKLFEEKQLRPFAEGEADYTDAAYTELVWGPLKEHIERCDNVYFAPDGLLHQTGIEYLPDYGGEGLMGDHRGMHRLSSTRQLALRKETSPSRSATLYGGIEYDTEPSEMKKESDRYRSGIRGSEMSGIEDATMKRALDETDRGTVAPLAYTLPEVKGIDTLLKDKGYSTRLYSGKEASEESFKALSGQGSGILHIATHGRYLKEDEAEKEVARNHRLMFMSQDRDMMTRHVEDKALTRSWLYMSGANRTLKREPLDEGVDNGILTAQEISQMDLRGTDLVVLSACQTGLGDIGSDGVFGLQRGFKKAGANTILMSLWKVDDEATQILMTEFYRHYLSGKSKQESLRLAQKTLRKDSRFKDPHSWAAFILLDALN